MKRRLIALALMLGGEGAAQACGCLPLANDPVAVREFAELAASRAVAFVEVDVVAGYDRRRGRGERMRVRQVLGGSAPREFRIDRPQAPDNAVCDAEYPAGSRALMLIYGPRRDARGRLLGYSESKMCIAALLRSRPEFRDALIEAFRRKSAGLRAPEPAPIQRVGTSFSSRPCESPRSSSRT